MRISLWFITTITSISFIYCNQELVLNQTWFDGSPKISEIDLGNNIFEVTYYTKSSTKVYSYKYKSDGSETIKLISIQYYKDGVEKKTINFTKTAHEIENILKQVIVADYELEKAKINYSNNNKEKLLTNTTQDEFESTSEYLARIEKNHLEYLKGKKEYLKSFRDNLLTKFSLTAETDSFYFSLIDDYDIYSGKWRGVVIYDEYKDGVICERSHDHEQSNQRFDYNFNFDRNKARKVQNNIENITIKGKLTILPNFQPHLIEFNGNEENGQFEFNMPNIPNVVFESGRDFRDGVVCSHFDYICAFWNDKKENTLVFDMKINETIFLKGKNPVFIRDGDYIITTKVLYNVNTGETSMLHPYQERYYGNNFISDGLSLSIMTINTDRYSDLFIYNNLDKKYIYDSKAIYKQNGQRPWGYYKLFPKSIFYHDNNLKILFYNAQNYNNRGNDDPTLFLWDIDSQSIIWEINEEDLDAYIQELGIYKKKKSASLNNIKISDDKKYFTFNVKNGGYLGVIGIFDMNTGELIKSINNATNGYFYDFTTENELFIKNGVTHYNNGVKSYKGADNDEFSTFDFFKMKEEDVYKVKSLNNIPSTDQYFEPDNFSSTYDRRFLASFNPISYNYSSGVRDSRINMGKYYYYNTFQGEWPGKRTKYIYGVMIQYIPQINN